jgi:hypothetical protein
MPRKRFTAIERHMHDPEIPKLVAFDRLPWGPFKEIVGNFSGLPGSVQSQGGIADNPGVIAQFRRDDAQMLMN